MREITNRIINRIPDFYNRDDKSVLLSIVDSISCELEIILDNINTIINIISIDKVNDDDLYNRFGALLNLTQYSYESNSAYRARIKSTIMSNRYGGIVDAIKSTVATYIGLTNIDDINKYIYICGTWEYDNRFGSIDGIDKSPGNMVCAIDSRALIDKDWVTTKELISIINGIKAAGVKAYTTYTYPIIYDECNILIDDISSELIEITTSYVDNKKMRIYDNYMKEHIGMTSNDNVGIHITDMISMILSENEQTAKMLVSDKSNCTLHIIGSLLNRTSNVLNSSFILNKLSQSIDKQDC